MNIGVLALQGDFFEHRCALEQRGQQVLEVRSSDSLRDLVGLVIPGGESTTIGMLLEKNQMLEPLRERIQRGMPVMGTCAGTILLARDIEGRARLAEGLQPSLGAMDISVRRNAYGRQVNSFEELLEFPGGSGHFMRALFIRAPQITRVGPGVKILASLGGGESVAVQQENILALTFHPELAEDQEIHCHFLEMVKKWKSVTE